MKGEQVGNSGPEKLPAGLNLEIEELEQLVAPGNTWSV